LGGGFFNILLGGGNVVFQVSDVVFKSLFLDIEDVSEVGFSVGNIQIGVGDFIVQSSNFIVVESSSLLIIVVSSLEFNLEVFNNLLDSINKGVKGTVGHHV
jgi:hypothetical protein